MAASLGLFDIFAFTIAPLALGMIVTDKIADSSPAVNYSYRPANQLKLELVVAIISGRFPFQEIFEVVSAST